MGTTGKVFVVFITDGASELDCLHSLSHATGRGVA